MAHLFESYVNVKSYFNVDVYAAFYSSEMTVVDDLLSALLCVSMYAQVLQMH